MSVVTTLNMKTELFKILIKSSEQEQVTIDNINNMPFVKNNYIVKTGVSFGVNEYVLKWIVVHTAL